MALNVIKHNGNYITVNPICDKGLKNEFTNLFQATKITKQLVGLLEKEFIHLIVFVWSQYMAAILNNEQ